jgi:hypothetical protein
MEEATETEVPAMFQEVAAHDTMMVVNALVPVSIEDPYCWKNCSGL